MNEENTNEADTRQESPVEKNSVVQLHRVMIPEAVIRPESTQVVANKNNFEKVAMIKTEKRKRGRPLGSKNKNKPTPAVGMKPLPLKQLPPDSNKDE